VGSGCGTVVRAIASAT